MRIPNSKSSLSLAMQLNLFKTRFIYNSNTSFASQEPLPDLKSQFSILIGPAEKSHSITNIIAIVLQKSDSRENEQSEKLSPLSTIFDFKLTKHYQIPKLSSNTKNSNCKYQAIKSTLLFAPSQLIFHEEIYQNFNYNA